VNINFLARFTRKNNRYYFGGFEKFSTNKERVKRIYLLYIVDLHYSTLSLDATIAEEHITFKSSFTADVGFPGGWRT